MICFTADCGFGGGGDGWNWDALLAPIDCATCNADFSSAIFEVALSPAVVTTAINVSIARLHFQSCGMGCRGETHDASYFLEIGAAVIGIGKAALSFVGRSLVNKSSRAVANAFPSNLGFIGPVDDVFLLPGQKIDRFGGSAVSRFFSPQGTSLTARSLPPGSTNLQLRTFEVMKPLPVKSGLIAPAYGQFGLGTQYVTPIGLDPLLKRGILKELP